jgi:hypothetical protein
MAKSADLKFMAIALPGVPIYTSTNSGAAWKAEDIFPAQWSSLAGSADASKLVAVSLDGAIFTYQAVPTLSIAISGGNAILTWTASGADFDLQQTSDLRAPTWITVTNVPMVINGQSQVTLPVTSRNFFRLKSR